jgi:pimeloyl-ACP methyl ester carboxylesterase
MKYPAHVNRVVQIGAMQPHAGKQYPEHLTGADATLAEFLRKIAQLQEEIQPDDPREAAKQFWALLRVLMVANPADADKIQGAPYEYPNELGFMKHWTEKLLPSIQALNLHPDEISKVKTPVLTVHGRRDRQAPYGGGREWALLLPNARLLTVEGAAHVPWIEAPDMVYRAIETFLDGTWPELAKKVESLEPSNEAGKSE